MTTVRIGNVEITALLDTAFLFRPDIFFPGKIDEWLATDPGLVDERGLARMSICCYLLRSAGKTILVDTGLGPRKRDGFPRSHLDESLASAGIAPADIDIVVNTHLHIDHTGWNTYDAPDGTRQPYFPRARWFIQDIEWDYWMRPEHLDDPERPHLRECVEPLAGRVELIHGEATLDENLTFVPSPGHTPGHVGIGVYSAGERAIIAGDASHHPIQLLHPDWSPTFDQEPLAAATTRARLFDEAAGDGRVWIAGHWAFPGMGRIVPLEGGRVFQAL